MNQRCPRRAGSAGYGRALRFGVIAATYTDDGVIVDRTVDLPASAGSVWKAAKTPEAFRFVTKRLLVMPVVANRQEDWREGETVVGWVFLFGFVPFSRHRLHFSQVDDGSMTLRSRESGGLVKVWNHDITVTPLGPDRCRYGDRIEIDAGLFTPLVGLYANGFYMLRQRRWRKLAEHLSAG